MRLVAVLKDEFAEAFRHPFALVYWFVLVIAIVAFSILAIVQYSQGKRLTATEASEGASRVARVENCYQSAESRPATLGILRTLEGTIHVNIDTTLALLEIQPTGPVADARRNSLQRLRSEQILIHNYVALTDSRLPRTFIRDGRPRVPQCEALARILDINLEDRMP